MQPDCSNITLSGMSHIRSRGPAMVQQEQVLLCCLCPDNRSCYSIRRQAFFPLHHRFSHIDHHVHHLSYHIPAMWATRGDKGDHFRLNDVSRDSDRDRVLHQTLFLAQRDDLWWRYWQCLRHRALYRPHSQFQVHQYTMHVLLYVTYDRCWSHLCL